MSNEIDQENSDLKAEKKETQMIKKITAAVIAVIRTANFADTSVTVAFAVIDINNKFSKQFKLKNIEFFDSELNIKKNTIITNNKF